MRITSLPIIGVLRPTLAHDSQTSAAGTPSTNRTSSAAKLLAAALEPASANFATRKLGLNKYFGKILGEQHFLPGKNDVFCPFSAWESLFAVQRFNKEKVIGKVEDYLSASPEKNKDCWNKYFEERDNKFDIYSFGERIAGLIDERDRSGEATLNDLYKQPNISVFSCDPCSRDDIAAAIGRMNDFVCLQTDGSLRDIGGLLFFRKDVRGTLMGVANLVARWEQPFDQKDTAKSKFYTDDEKNIIVDMMTQKYSDGLLNADPGKGYELMFARPFATQGKAPVIVLYALPQKGVPPEAQTKNRANLLKHIGENGLDGLGLSPVIADTFSVPKFDMQQTRKVAFPGAEDYLTTPTGSFDIRQTARFEHGEGLPGNFWLGQRKQSPREAIEYAHKPVGVPGEPEVHVELNRPFEVIVMLPGGLIWHVLHVSHPTQSGTLPVNAHFL